MICVTRGTKKRSTRPTGLINRDWLYWLIKTSRRTGKTETLTKPALYQKSAISRDGLSNIRVIAESHRAPKNIMVENAVTPGVCLRFQLKMHSQKVRAMEMIKSAIYTIGRLQKTGAAVPEDHG